MTDQIDFIRAIIENPDDDPLRLVYADWLTENGQEERGELIRVQMELAKLGPKPPECTSGYDRILTGGICLRCQRIIDWACDAGPLDQRSSNLLQKLASEFPYFTSHNWSRGFVEEVYATAERFLEDVDKAIWKKTEVCPNCDGLGETRFCDAAGDMDDEPCKSCGGSLSGGYKRGSGNIDLPCPLTAHPIRCVVITSLASPSNPRMQSLSTKHKYDWWPTDGPELNTTWELMLAMFEAEWPGIKFTRGTQVLGA